MTNRPLEKIYWVSSSHWDREWHRPFEGFRARLVEMVDRAIEYVSRDEDYGFFFLDGQSIILEDYLAVRPEMEARLRELITDGKLDAGPFYVLQDEMIEDGELLIRNLQRGIAIARKFGAREFVGYSPDSFGHCAQLPQILKLAGVPVTIFGRGFNGSQQENLWSAPDRSAVFFIWLPFGYGGYAHQDCLEGGRHIPEDGDEALAMFEKRFERLQPFVKSGVTLVMDGGDHLSPDRNVVSLAASYNTRHPDGPRFEIVSLLDAARWITRHPNPHRVEGEIREHGPEPMGWILPGTYSTRMPLKHGLSTLTRQLLALEKLATLRPYCHFTQTQIERAWQLLLQNIPHDSICGCHIDEVYLENLTRLNSARSIISHLYERTLRAFYPASDRTAKAMRAIFYDPAPTPATFKPFEVECPFSIIENPDRIALEAPGVEFVFSDVEQYWTDHSHLTTYRIKGFYQNKTGANIFDALVVERLSAGLGQSRHTATTALKRSTTNGCLTFVDSGDAGDTFSYSPPERDSIVHSQGEPQTVFVRTLSNRLTQTKAEVLLAVPASLTSDRKARSKETVKIRVRYDIVSDLDSGISWINGVVHNTARDHRLRIVFPTTAQEAHSLAGAPFHVERRLVKLKFDPDEFTERPGTDYPFVDYIRYGGVSVYAQSNGEYQITARGIEITLCRCVGWLGRPDLQYRKGQAGPFYETPMAQLVEADIPFGFIIAPSLPDRVADYRRKEFLQTTRTLCVPTDQAVGKHDALPLRVRGAELTALRWISGQEIEARLFNAAPKPALARLEMASPWTKAVEMDLNHEHTRPVGDSLSLRPWQVLTLKLIVV